jgi:hypothetical protein
MRVCEDNGVLISDALIKIPLSGLKLSSVVRDNEFDGRFLIL